MFSLIYYWVHKSLKGKMENIAPEESCRQLCFTDLDLVSLTV